MALELRPAKLPSRALAVLLDLVVSFIGYIIITMVLAVSTASLDEAAQMAISIAAFVLVLVGGPIRFRHALVRGAVGVVEILMTLGVIACIASLV